MQLCTFFPPQCRVQLCTSLHSFVYITSLGTRRQGSGQRNSESLRARWKQRLVRMPDTVSVSPFSRKHTLYHCWAGGTSTKLLLASS